LGREIVLPGATFDASGQHAGGTIHIGGDFHGRNPNIVNAQTVTVTGATTIRANATDSGNGGRVAIWSEGETEFLGSVAAHGGATGGDGGFVEVSGKRNLNYGGSADAGARLGRTGTLLLDPRNIVISEAPVGLFPQFDLIDPHPTQVGGFGTEIRVLGNGNVVVTNPNDSFGASFAGVAYLFNPSTGALISSLIGSNTNDQVGLGDPIRGAVIPLSNGNYVVQSSRWNGVRGAVTWGNGDRGVSGTVSAANSLIGTDPSEGVGGVIALSNGNYLITDPFWNGNRGAVTWGDGTTGVRGMISEANSLVGGNAGDQIGGGSLFALRNGNYLVASQRWNGDRGAVTWGNGAIGVRGTVSEANSLVGTSGNDRIGFVTLLSNGNYVVESYQWNGSRGAATWGDGTIGVRGAVSEANSLIGSDPNDQVGLGVTSLTNGNYVIRSYQWNGRRGAVTWGDGSTGVHGAISQMNSLVGSNPNDQVGSGDYFHNGIISLSNGNYVVPSPQWNDHRGAVTWGDGSSGVRGTVSEANSLLGSNANDFVGREGITPLSNGNYVVASATWNGIRGAATWGDGSIGIRGPISDANSVVGSHPNDWVSREGVTPLTNGNYVVISAAWKDARGAVTWGDGRRGVNGTVSEANSLVGSIANDLVGYWGVTPLSNGNYVVPSLSWNGNRGAATWGDGLMGVRGTISNTNSLVGSNPNEVGRVTALSNGNYVVRSPGWNGLRGAATWGDGRRGISGTVSEVNSLVGSSPNDLVGVDGVITLSNGNYLVQSTSWNGLRGAVTWGDGAQGIVGIVSDANSLVGTNSNDRVESGGVTLLSNGDYLVSNPNWGAQHAAVTWSSGTIGQTLDGRGVVTPQNSLVGRASDPGLSSIVEDPAHESFIARFVHEVGGRITVGLTDPNQQSYSRGQAQTVTLTSEFLTATLNTGTAVVLQASNDIIVNSPITVSAGGQGGALTLQAGRSIVLNAGINTDNGNLTLIANDRLASGVVDPQRDPGNAFITMALGTSLNTGTGALTVDLRDGAGLTHRDRAPSR
jgi:hypothetical protein